MSRQTAKFQNKVAPKQVKRGSMDGGHPLWTLRSKEEASKFWEAEFGSTLESDARKDDSVDQARRRTEGQDEPSIA